MDELRCMIVVDSDEDEETAVTIGEVAFSDDLEVETFAGRRPDTNVVFVDGWGTWLSAAAPIRDEEGLVVGLVSAGKAPWEGLRASALRSAVSDTFAEMMRSAAARQTRAEIESMTDALTGLCNHRHFQESPARTGGRGAARRPRPRAALLRYRPFQAAERSVWPPGGRRRAAPRRPGAGRVDPSWRRGGALRRR